VTDRASLADRLVAALEANGPAPCSKLALAVGARKQVVLDVLRSARRFEHAGHGSTSSWRVAGTMREQTCGLASPDPDPEVTLELRETLEAIQARLTAIEEQQEAILALLEPAPPANADDALDGQIDVFEAIAATNGEATS
jgi:hypothetical protein